MEKLTSTNRNIRVMHVLPALDADGGMQKVLTDALLHFSGQRFQHEVCCLIEKGELGTRVEIAGVPVFLETKKTWWDYSLPVRLMRLFKRRRTNVVHSYSGVYRDGCLGALLARVPVIVHTDHGKFYPDSRWTRLNHRFFSRFRDRVIGVSNGIGDFLVSEVGIAPQKVMTIYNGIDIAAYGKAVDRTAWLRMLSVPLDSLVVGMVGRLVPVKDHKTFFQAARLVLDALPTVRFLVVGDGPLESELKNDVQELGISNEVSFLGYRDDIPELMSLFDLAVISSLHESFSLVLAEANACGKAVVATRVGGIPELVEDGVTGILVPPKEPELLARAIVDLLQDSSRRQAMGLAGRARVEERFTIEKMVRSYESLYESLLEKKLP